MLTKTQVALLKNYQRIRSKSINICLVKTHAHSSCLTRAPALTNLLQGLTALDQMLVPPQHSYAQNLQHHVVGGGQAIGRRYMSLVLCPSLHVRLRQEEGHLGNGLSWVPEAASTWITDFLTPRTGRHKFLLIISPQSLVYCWSTLNQ